MNVEGLEVLVSVAVGAVLAVGAGGGVEEVAAGRVGEGPGVLGTGLASRGVEAGRLGDVAEHGLSVEGGGQDAADPVRARVHVVRPVAPEDGQHAVRLHDAVEEAEHDEEEGEDLMPGSVGLVMLCVWCGLALEW